MGYVFLILSGLGLLHAVKFRQSFERYHILKLFLYWFLSIITITISGSMPLPIGLAIALFIYVNTNINKQAKLLAILYGLTGYILSVISFFIFS